HRRQCDSSANGSNHNSSKGRTAVMTDRFESLFFTEATFGSPTIIGSTMTVPVEGVLPLRGYSPAKENRMMSGRMVFEGVERSRRTVVEYIGDPRHPDGFKEPYVVEDAFDSKIEGVTYEYAFEGVQEKPRAWVDWVISAKRFEFIIDEDE